MKKRVLQISVFVILVSLGCFLIQAAGGAIPCHCFDEQKAEAIGEGVCQLYTGTPCAGVQAEYSYCLPDTKCRTRFFIACYSGHTFKRWINTPCWNECNEPF